MTETPSMRDNLLQDLQSNLDHFAHITSDLSAAEQVTPFTDEGWSIKDFLAHTAHWKKAAHALLVAYLHDQPLPPPEPSGDEANEVQRLRHASFSLREVQADWQANNTHLKHLIVDELDEQHLAKEVRVPWDAVDSASIYSILNDICEHDIEHFDFIEQRLNQIKQA